MAFWPLVKAAVPPADMEGCVSGMFTPWWTDTGSWVTEVRAAMEKYRSDEAADLVQATGYIMNWAYGKILVDALRRAADKVGGENVTGMDLFEAIRETDMTVEGWTYPWKISPDANVLMRGVRLYEYRASEEDWMLMEDYVIPPSLGG